MIGTLFVLTAPSGTGKTTLANALLASTGGMCRSISYTTRPCRSGEEPGVHYWFVNQDEFAAMIRDGAFIEYACVFNNYYGTSKQQVAQHLQAGEDVILAIDWQGAAQIRQQFPTAITIFILPPSRALLQQRLQGRQQDEQAVIATRLSAASDEVTHFNEFDYLIINDVFTEALADLQAIVRANRLSQRRQSVKYAGLLAEWIKT
jgi:guanylate kinase